MLPSIDVHTDIHNAADYYVDALKEFAAIKARYGGTLTRFKSNLDDHDIVTLENMVAKVLHPLCMVPAVAQQSESTHMGTPLTTMIGYLRADILEFLGKYENTNAAYMRLQELLEDK